MREEPAKRVRRVSAVLTLKDLFLDHHVTSGRVHQTVDQARHDAELRSSRRLQGKRHTHRVRTAVQIVLSTIRRTGAALKELDEGLRLCPVHLDVRTSFTDRNRDPRCTHVPREDVTMRHATRLRSVLLGDIPIELSSHLRPATLQGTVPNPLQDRHDPHHQSRVLRQRANLEQIRLNPHDRVVHQERAAVHGALTSPKPLFQFLVIHRSSPSGGVSSVPDT